jgi:hypothetical protein
MAKYDVKDVFYLDTTMALAATFDAGDQQSKALDVSSYVNPIASGRTKGTGLAVYKVQFTYSDTSGNRPVVGAESAGFRVGLIAGWSETGAEAATDLSTAYLNSANDLCIAGQDYYSPSSTTAIANSYPPSSMMASYWCEPSTDVPYVVVRDSIGLVAVSSINATAAMNIGVRLSCAIITLDQSTLNQLLRTQTV